MSLTPGFADPVLDAQSAFRALLEAMSRPGRICAAGDGLHPPEGLAPAAGAALLALADADTPVWTDAGEALRGWLGFHTGCRFAADPAAAAFALACRAAPPLSALHPGSDEEPERGATLVLQVGALAAGGGWRLSGPGIDGAHHLAVQGAPADFAAQWAANRARFPRGVDVVLCAGRSLAALPRTVLLEIA